MRALGKTGADASVLCLGGWHIGFSAQQDEAEAIRIMHAAVDEGMTFFDNAWDYHDGYSEVVMGKALATDGRRDKVFLMTKGCDRDYAGAMRCIDESLKRLNTDYLDLWQFHEIVYDNDPDWVFEQGGIQAAIEAKEAGKIRHIGFTGHRDPRIHQTMLDKPFDWETQWGSALVGEGGGSTKVSPHGCPPSVERGWLHSEARSTNHLVKSSPTCKRVPNHDRCSTRKVRS